VNIVGVFPFKTTERDFRQRYASLLAEIEAAIAAVDATICQTKISREKTKAGRTLYSPKALNRAFKTEFFRRGWKRCRVPCDYSTQTPYLRPGYPLTASEGAFREMDFVKGRLGVEVQFGKYAFMVYNVCAKMTIFHKLGHIEAGVEIVPMNQLASEMSSGVSYFEQFVWDLEHRGPSDIDIPVLILGVV